MITTFQEELGDASRFNCYVLHHECNRLRNKELQMDTDKYL